VNKEAMQGQQRVITWQQSHTTAETQYI